MKKTLKWLGIQFCAVAIPLGISLLINGYGSVDEQQRSMLVVLLYAGRSSLSGVTVISLGGEVL